MRWVSCNHFRSLFAFLLVLVFAQPGAVAELSQLVLKLNAETLQGAAVYSALVLNGSIDRQSGTYNWATSGATPLIDPVTGQHVGTLTSASVTVTDAPKLSVNLSVRAAAQPATFSATPVLLFVDPVPAGAALGRASAAFVVSDLNGNGAMLRGVGPPGTGAYRAYYEDFGHLFTQLVSQVSVGPNGTATGFQNDPPFGFRPIANGLSDFGALIAFSLTPGDWASATTEFELDGPVVFSFYGRGDMNCDLGVSPGDIAAFVLAVVSPEAYETAFPDCDVNLADVNIDGVISPGDITAFVDRLVHLGSPSGS